MAGVESLTGGGCGLLSPTGFAPAAIPTHVHLSACECRMSGLLPPLANPASCPRSHVPPRCSSARTRVLRPCRSAARSSMTSSLCPCAARLPCTASCGCSRLSVSLPGVAKPDPRPCCLCLASCAARPHCSAMLAAINRYPSVSFSSASNSDLPSLFFEKRPQSPWSLMVGRSYSFISVVVVFLSPAPPPAYLPIKLSVRGPSRALLHSPSSGPTCCSPRPASPRLPPFAAPPPTTILCAWAQPEPPARTQEPCNAKPKTSQRSRRSPSPERRPVLENRAADRRAPSPSSARFAGPESSRSNPVPPRVPRRRAASVPLLSHSPEPCPLRILCCRPSIRLPPLGKIPAAAASPHRR